MSGSKTNSMTLNEVRAAVCAIPPKMDFVWDGVDEADQPASEAELKAGLEAVRRGRGRPSGSDKTQIALRVDNDVLAAFRASGKGWQTRVNEALREWLKTHSPT